MTNMADLLAQLIAIKEQKGISLSQIMLRTGNKYNKTTIANFFARKTANPNMETFVDFANACEANLILETEGSKRAELQGDIADFHLDYLAKCEELEKANGEIARMKELHDAQEEQITKLTSTVEKQQNTIEHYIVRMERAEDAMYRKDARIVELSKACGLWDPK